MGTRLFAGNLPASMTDDELPKVFRRFGAVKFTRLGCSDESGASKRFGQVGTTTGALTDDAILYLDLPRQNYPTIIATNARSNEASS